VQDNSPSNQNQSANAAGKNQLSVTLGQSKGGSQDAAMSAEDAKKKDGAAGAVKGENGKLKDPNQAHETLDIAKNVPQARFGHTITMVNKYKVVLFGGATGDTGKYSMTGETFIFNMLLKAWTELNGK
jgi:hypothetical protein